MYRSQAETDDESELPVEESSLPVETASHLVEQFSRSKPV